MTITSGSITNKNDIIVADDANDTFNSSGGNDSVSSGGGNDFVDGGAGQDTLDGGNGHDTLFGGHGADMLVGGAGNDVLRGGDGSDQIDGGIGDDLLDLSDATKGVNLTLKQGVNAGDANGYWTTGNLFGIGSDSYKNIEGVIGSAFNDTITGSTANDILIGASGADIIAGGSGNDVFVYAAASDSTASVMDTITDFVQGQDKIDLTALLGAATLKWGGQIPTQLGVWTELDGNGNTLVKADTNNDLAPDLVIKLQGVIDPLTIDDFIGVNRPPVVTGGVTLAAFTEDNGTRLITQAELLANASDPDGQPLTAIDLEIASGNGTLHDNLNGSWTYTPEPNDDTSVTFSYSVTDGVAPPVAAAATMDITPQYDLPVAQSIAIDSLEDEMVTVTLSGSGVEAPIASYTLVSLPVVGTLYLDELGTMVAQVGVAYASPTFYYVPPPDFPDFQVYVHFSYSVSDGFADSASADVQIGIAPVNDAPVADDDSYIQVVNLDHVAAGYDGFTIIGEDANDRAGLSVAAVGDVNGDGLGDFIIGAPQVQNGPSAFGAAYVVFGKTDTAIVDLSDIAAGNGGFKIIGEAEYLDTAYSVSSAGDVNNDGITDFLIGAPDDHNILTDPNINAGGTYVVFGKNDTAAVNLADVAAGLGGFKIIGDSAFDFSGISVSAVGDVNADGFADIVIGAYGDGDGGSFAGAAYVVFGKADGLLVDLEDVANGVGGFKIIGENANDELGWSVSGAGDVNGDDIADVIVGSFQLGDIGAAYVVFGKSDTSAINLDIIGDDGFKIIAEAAGDLAGFSVSAGGDLNNDGLADVLVSAPGGFQTGAAYVVFGKEDTDTVNLSDVALGDGGFKIIGEAGGDFLGTSVAAAGDVNGDGYADIIIGRSSPLQTPNPALSSAAYVVYGGANLSTIDLADVAAGIGGFRIVSDGLPGFAVSAAGDVNGDGIDDLLVGASGSNAGSIDSGAAYVIYGHANQVSEDRAALIGNVLDNDSDVDGDALTIYSFDAVSASGAVVTAGPTPGTFVYDPTAAAAIQALGAGESITDTFTYTVTDGNGEFDTATVSVTVHGANDPVINGTVTGSVTEDLFSLGEPTLYAAGSPWSVKVALDDINGDGHVDMVTANALENTVSALLNDGSGSFGTPATYTVGGSTSDVVLADLDGDGNQDIVATTKSVFEIGNTVSVLLGDGQGGFGQADVHELGAVFPTAVAVGDVNGDGYVDVVTANNDGVNRVSVLLGDGVGGFGDPTLYGAGNTAVDLAVADMNGDGKLDIVTADISNGSVSVLLNNDNTGFFDANVYALLGSVAGVAVADLDGDGDDDVVTSGLDFNIGQNVAWVWINDGIGGLVLSNEYGVGSVPLDVSLADMNSDGAVDIVTADAGSDTVSVLLNDGTGEFGTSMSYAVGANDPRGVALADVNGDGTTDVVTADIFDNVVSVLLNPTATTSGVLTAGDPDSSASQNWTIVGAAFSAYGTFELVGNTGQWRYSLDNGSAAVQALAAGESHEDSFTVRVMDDHGAFAEQDVTISVNGVNDAPVAQADTWYLQVDSFVSFTMPLGSLLDNDTDVDGDTLSIVAIGNFSGDIIVFLTGDELQVITGDASGGVTAGFDYFVTDGSSADAMVHVTVNIAESAATVNADDLSVGSVSGSWGYQNALEGADILTSGAGNDILVGGAGNDTLVGGAGNDILAGGSGEDAMTGGDGSDTFIFKVTDFEIQSDIISDFTVGAGGDVLDISDVLSGSGATQDTLQDFVHVAEAVGVGVTFVTVSPPGVIGNTFLPLAVLSGVTGITLGDLQSNNQIIF